MINENIAENSDEVSRWLTNERIARSEIVKLALFDNRETWNGLPDDAPEDWLFAVFRIFACGFCYDLANAVACETGLPLAVIRRRGDTGLRIVHAVIYEPQTGFAADILGRRQMADVVQELRSAVGDVTVALSPGEIDWDDTPREREDMAAVAAGLPWLPRNTARRQLTPFAILRDLVLQRAASCLDHPEVDENHRPRSP